MDKFITKDLIETYGEPGSPIMNSEYVRAYCLVCGDPLRVVSDYNAATCNDCDNPAGHIKSNGLGDRTVGLCERQAAKMGEMEGEAD